MHKLEMRKGLSVRIMRDGRQHPKYPGVYRIDKINPKTATLVSETNEWEVVNAPHAMVELVEGAIIKRDPRIAEKVELADRAGQGVIIKAVAGSELERKGFEGPHVIIGVRGDKVQAVKLGGKSNGRYWSLSSSSRSWEVVSLDELMGISV